jgi:hypothetical protein
MAGSGIKPAAADSDRGTDGVNRWPQVKSRYLPFSGGFDDSTPPWGLPPGTLREAQNFEVGVNGAYNTIVGYERYDGQARPSDAQYGVFTVGDPHTIVVGDTVTGATSGETSICIAVTDDNVIVTKISGAYETDGETLNGSGGGSAVATTAAIIDGAGTSLLHATYNNLAADEYRDDIDPVTGSGDLLGVKMLNDVKYVFRNNAGGTAAALFKSSGSGWAAVALGRELSFTSGGTYEIAEGNTITGATSGSTAVITRVMLESGTFAAGTAAGRLIFASQSAAFQAENLDVGGNLNVATIAADSTAITLLPDGRYEMVVHNFGGQSGTTRIYGCDGVNRGFEFDGTVFCPIDTGMDTDTPTHVIGHLNHLFFSFAGSAQHSGTGFPYQWTLLSGAAELALGDDITGFKRQPGVQAGGALTLFSRNSIHTLYGTSSSDWSLVAYREEIGGTAYSMQDVGFTLFLDDRGLTNLETVESFGNFKHSVFTNGVKTFLNQRRTSVQDSCIVREKNQYRIFFADKYALYITLDGRKITGIMPILLSHKVTCMCSQENSDGEEEIYFGSDDGHVYQMEKGTSFDGAAIEFYLLTHFNHLKQPNVIKSWTDCLMEVRGEGYGAFNFTYELGYASVDIPQPGIQAETVDFSSSIWDVFTWDEFIWDGKTLSPSHTELEGDAENISVIIRGSSDEYVPMKFSGALLSYIDRYRLTP